MNKLLSFAALVLGATAQAPVDLQERWANYKVKWGKKYATAAEEMRRFEIFNGNMETAAELSALNPEARFGATKFADWHPNEFAKVYLNYKPDAVTRSHMPLAEPLDARYSNSTCTDDACDWKAQGAVHAPRDQKQCGSCWAFSTVEQIASDNFLAGNRLEELSPQQLVDCEKPDQGCNGGDPVNAYPYFVKVGGVESELSYPYTGVDGACKFKKDKIAVSISGFKQVVPACEGTFNNCKNQTSFVSNAKEYIKTTGPASICVNAEPWQTYEGGVFTSKLRCSGAQRKLDHCVQLTGYGKKATGTEYWVVRNSWGLDWGEDGFIWIKTGENLCGVLDAMTVSTIAK
jgi:cathepsin F